ncbi:hypothetical protein EYF80_012309 [Liparis tanakae]|uniref:Uncharacterized protein n=1 Tax=Liparis tanakae TaxID=230148 RepID=A0A4Z2IIG0_9TELE|nr:hypothetical protein EYF80_012309 [Liparis tanakae]
MDGRSTVVTFHLLQRLREKLEALSAVFPAESSSCHITLQVLCTLCDATVLDQTPVGRPTLYQSNMRCEPSSAARQRIPGSALRGCTVTGGNGSVRVTMDLCKPGGSEEWRRGLKDSRTQGLRGSNQRDTWCSVKVQ